MSKRIQATLSAAAAVFGTLLLNACSMAETVAAPDMSPVGDGLSLIGVGIVLAAIVSLIGVLMGQQK